MAKPRVDPALVPFLDALAELLVSAILKERESPMEDEATAEIVELPKTKRAPRRSPRPRTRSVRQ